MAHVLGLSLLETLRIPGVRVLPPWKTWTLPKAPLGHPLSPCLSVGRASSVNHPEGYCQSDMSLRASWEKHSMWTLIHLTLKGRLSHLILLRPNLAATLGMPSPNNKIPGARKGKWEQFLLYKPGKRETQGHTRSSSPPMISDLTSCLLLSSLW